MSDFDWVGTFNREFDKAIAKDVAKSGFRPDEFMSIGRGNTQTEPWWREKGPGFAKAFADWYEAQSDTSVWITPDGKPAIELRLNVKFGEVPVVVYIDLILKMGTALVITDLKTSASEPDTVAQQGVYACAVELAYGPQWRPRYGTHFMCRGMGKKDEEPKTFFMPPEDLSGYRYSIPYYTRQFAILDRAAEGGIFIPNPGDHCRICGVAAACAAVGGSEASKYQPR